MNLIFISANSYNYVVFSSKTFTSDNHDPILKLCYGPPCCDVIELIEIFALKIMTTGSYYFSIAAV